MKTIRHQILLTILLCICHITADAQDIVEDCYNTIRQAREEINATTSACHDNKETDTRYKIMHTIQRGETIDYLSEIYAVDTDSIIAINYDVKDFFTGMQIFIPVYEKEEIAPSSITDKGDATSQEYKETDMILADNRKADELLVGANYKKAQKLYSQIINRYSTTHDCTGAFYGRAQCLYNRGKWKSAIKDFQTVINSGKANHAVDGHCKELLADAQQRRAQQLEERANMWGELFSTVATVGISVMEAHEANKNRTRTTSGTSESSTPSRETDDNDYSPAQSSATTTKKTCRNCFGSKRCPKCNGNGHYFDNGMGIPKEIVCHSCGGDGRCHKC